MNVRSSLRLLLVVGIAFAALVASTAAAPQREHAAVAANAFRNPLNTGADPTLVHHAGYYYLSTTQGDRIRIWKANSLATLINAPGVTVWQDSDPTRNKQVWAPAMYQFNGRWYIYYTASDGIGVNHRMHVIESAGDDPMGPYAYKAELGDYGYGIDGEPMVHNGRLYFTWAAPGRGFTTGPQQIYIAAMSNPWTTTGTHVALPVGNGTCPEVREGPTFLYRNGRTFLTYSTCDTGKPDYSLWMISIANGLNPMVPANWVRYPTARFARNNAAGVYGPGHHFFFKSPDGTQDWIAYHAKNTSAVTYSWRTTRAQRISWHADGTPNLGVPVALGTSLALPSGDPGPAVRTINDFDVGTGDGQVAYSGAWSSGTGCGVQCHLGNDHWSGTAGHTATFRFTGTQIALYSVRDTGNGIAAMSIDGGPERLVDYYGSPRVGQQLNYLSPKLTPGAHTLRVRVTGTKNASATWTAVSIDRADIWP